MRFTEKNTNYFPNDSKLHSKIFLMNFLNFQGGGGLVHQLRKSYSLTDLGHDESDSISNNERISAITSEPDEMIELEHKRRTGSASRPVKYVRHISHEPEQLPRRRRRSRENSP